MSFNGALHRINWDFGLKYFRRLNIIIKIYTEPNLSNGLYFQMYQGEINRTGFYFGIQTDVTRKDLVSGKTKGTGKGLIFTRWDTNDVANVRIGEDSWSEYGYEDGAFVSVRKNYVWTTHNYRLEIAFIESDDVGDWYGVWISDLDDKNEDFLGALRFPKTTPETAGIKDQGACARQTFIELYHRTDREAPIPTWHVSVIKIFANDHIYPRHARSEYGEIDNTDIYFDRETKEIHFFMGANVSRLYEANQLF